MDKCFPYVWIKYKSTDCPWVNNKFRRLVRKRSRVFKREGRSARWRQIKEETNRLMEELKKNYFEKMKEKAIAAENSKAYYIAVSMLGGKECPKKWDVRVLFPGLNDLEICEKLADYFNKISGEFQPLPEISEEIKKEKRCPPEMYQIAARLKKIVSQTQR